MLLEIKDAVASQGGNVILDHFDFYIKGNEKIAVVGRNGAGKTTLLQVLSGTLPLDANEKNPDAGIHFARKISIGVLSQSAVRDPERTVEEEILRLACGREGAEEDRFSKERFDFEAEFDRIFTGFGFSLVDRKKKLGSFSGGEQTKIMLIGLLLRKPDLLILDEPTNHLDLPGTEWLERYLHHYEKAVVAVSHDRYFIDEMADVVWEVTGGKLYRYPGNYTAYRKEKAAKWEHDKKAWDQQQAEIARLNELIKKFRNRPRKAAFARSRASILKRMEQMPEPVPDDAVIHKEPIVPARPGNRFVFTCKDLLIGYDHPLRKLTFRLRRGAKLGVIGPNGTGKSAFVRTIAGLLAPLGGELAVGEHIDAAFLDQMTARMQSEKTVIEYFHSAFPDLLYPDIRKTLAGYLFFEKDMGKKVRDLSGGEKTRLCLAEILERRPNFLILDEPTNNMDIPAKETLESIFLQYQGTILFVSHDRYFLSRVADALLVFAPGTTEITYYPSDYAHYAKRREEAHAGLSPDLARSAENQALIETLRSVPKKETGMLRQIPEEEQAFDWRFSLIADRKEQAEAGFRDICLMQEALPAEEADYDRMLEEEASLTEKREAARDAWTEVLLEWYDIYLDREAYREEKKGGGLTQI